MTAEPVKTRRVYEWSPPPTPPFSDLFAGGARTRGWLNHWILGKLQDGFYLAMYQVFRRSPIDFVSNFGAHLGWLVVKNFKPRTMEGARRNFRRLKPQWTDAEVEAAVERLYRHIGRVMTEFAILTRLAGDGRIRLFNEGALLGALEKGPVIIVSCHTGNWEVGASALNMLGLKWADFYVPPAREVQHKLANEIRETFGIRMLPPGKAGVRPAIRELTGGGCLSVFCDEVHYDKVMAPFFGREPHIDGNLAIAVRLARMTGARIVIGHTVRTEGCRFEVSFKEAIELPDAPPTQAQLQADVMMLNAQIEPIVAAHLDQWYFLDNDF